VRRHDPGRVAVGRDIVAAMLFRRRPALRREFSFLARDADDGRRLRLRSLQVPRQLSGGNMMIVAIGFIISFICAWIVVKTFLGYVQRHGFGLFAWWRIVVGVLDTHRVSG